MNALAEDAQEGMSAFVDKRVPCWKGRYGPLYTTVSRVRPISE